MFDFELSGMGSVGIKELFHGTTVLFSRSNELDIDSRRDEVEHFSNSQKMIPGRYQYYSCIPRP